MLRLHSLIWVNLFYQYINPIFLFAETKDFQLAIGDVVFLCTDGVYNEIGDEYLKNKLMDGVTAESLISEVLLQNPKDNIVEAVIIR